nr:PREDICTED: protein brunelleschi [Bemisia tabaci]XP_018912062.1 PREDICTED: protein brunelleschi [Bemisia tabaci]XP_018912063.1 PREDICTED: protein brunelleschi [Bemisia tabaci]
MRSSVSVILSGPTSGQSMSHPDYDQTPHDHACLLVLIKHLGETLTSKSFSRLFDRISRLHHHKICDSAGITRDVYIRFSKEYPVGNNDWGDFQTHRRLLGLVTIAKSKSQIEFNEICRLHECLKVKYQSTIIDSRCIMFGVNTPATPECSIPANFKSQALYFPSDIDGNGELDDNITEFILGLFWILESKRLERCREKIDRVSLLLAPFEKRDFVGLDIESRGNKKRWLGRMTKHLGDLSLQCGLPAEALTYYHSAVETLRSMHDWLWLGGAAEGWAAASVILLFPRLAKVVPVQRNASLQEGSSPKSRSNSEDFNPFGNSHKPLSASTMQNLLGYDEILKSYREAIIHYSKYQNAGVIETEACFKAARIAVKENSVLQAHSFLQNIILINLTLTEEEKIQRLMSLSNLYTNIGFLRKASFYRRLAATRYVSVKNPQTNWEQCYQLMLQSLPGYKLTLDPMDYVCDRFNGWPRIQKQVLNDLVVAAKRLGNPGLATRHMTFLLQVMWQHLTPPEKQDFSLQLQKLTVQCEGSPVTIILDSGLVVPPANLLNIPQLESFVIQNLKPHLRPIKLEKVKHDFGPFLYTPLSLGSLEKKSVQLDQKLDYCWVANELCEIVLEISNPLSFELEISNMLILTSELVFESVPLSVTLAPDASHHSVTLTGTPKEDGNLEINGYSTHTLGVKSNCRLRNIPNIPQNNFTIQVIPPMPRLQVTTSLPPLLFKLEPSATVTIFAGERMECLVTLHNEGNQPIDQLDIIVESMLDPSVQQQMIHWDHKGLTGHLPLLPGASATFPISLYGVNNFLAPHGLNPNQDFSAGKNSSMSGPSSFPSFSYRQSPLERSTPPSTCTASVRSGASSLNSLNSQLNKVGVDSPRKIECYVNLHYSGGPGLVAGYCRITSLVIYIEIIPSILITNWDVLPAETSEQFYLVLDISNMTSQEVELKYTASKTILIEQSESCRIPIPIDRCPLSQTQVNDEGDMLSGNQKSCNEHVTSHVLLEWNVPTALRKGMASLNGIILSPEMLDIVRTSPIDWKVTVNSKSLKPQSEFITQVGELLEFEVALHNLLGQPLQNLALLVQFYQDYQNGVINSQLDSCLAIAGTPETKFCQILEFGSIHHGCNVIFFSAGQYKLNIECCFQEKYVWRLIPPLIIDVKN